MDVAIDHTVRFCTGESATVNYACSDEPPCAHRRRRRHAAAHIVLNITGLGSLDTAKLYRFDVSA